MTRIHISSLIVVGAITTFLSSRAPAAQPSDAASMAPSKDFSCGTKENPCPLQGWMKDNASKPGSPAEFEAFFKKVAGFAPGAGFEKWATIANEGAAKAKGGDVEGAKAACKTCHTEYKAKYKSDIRDKPVK
jgi:hypothetical protein